LLTLSINSQNKEVSFNGKITFRILDKVTDAQEFDKSLKDIITKFDSVLSLSKIDDGFRTFNIPTLRLLLDPRESNNIIPVRTNYQFNDSTIRIQSSRLGSTLETIKLINAQRETYNIISTKGLKKIKENEIYHIDNSSDFTIIEFRDSLKTISGYKCFKVLMKENYDIKFDNISISDILPKSFKYTEMYVTDKIQSLYHPIINNRGILKRYYPLELRIWSDILKGKETLLLTEEIKIDKNSSRH